MRMERLNRLKSHKDYGYTYDMELISNVWLSIIMKTKKLLLTLFIILVGCSKPEPKDISTLDNIEGTYYFLNKKYSGQFYENLLDGVEYTKFYNIGSMKNGRIHGDLIKYKHIHLV